MSQSSTAPKNVVPPGNQTGVYYIPISNLSFNVTWKMIKDFVRQAAVVDRVEIFPDSTAGWVRVTGFDNFTKAFGILNGGELEGRAIIADGSNADNPIFVRNPDAPVSPSQNRPQGPMTGTSNPSSRYGVGSAMPWTNPGPSFSSPPLRSNMGFSQQWGNPVSPSRSRASALSGAGSPSMVGGSASTYGQFAGTATYSYPAGGTSTAPNVPEGYEQQLPYSSYAPVSEVEQYAYYGQAYPEQYQQEGSYPTQLNESDFSQLSISPTAVPPPHLYPAIPPGFEQNIGTEQLKLIIRNLPFKAKKDDIRGMIQNAAGSDLTQIGQIYVPADPARPERIKGHAFVTLRDPAAAARVCESPGQLEYMGRKLDVQFAKEGVSAGDLQQVGHRPKRPEQPPAPAARKPEGRDRDQDLDRKHPKKHEDKDKGKKHGSKKIVIAEGTWPS